MSALRRWMAAFAILLVTGFGIVGCEPGTTSEAPSATPEEPAETPSAVVPHDHDGDGVADHGAEEHGGE